MSTKVQRVQKVKSHIFTINPFSRKSKFHQTHFLTKKYVFTKNYVFNKNHIFIKNHVFTKKNIFLPKTKFKNNCVFNQKTVFIKKKCFHKKKHSLKKHFFDKKSCFWSSVKDFWWKSTQWQYKCVGLVKDWSHQKFHREKGHFPRNYIFMQI